jgi:hypothetical protein
MPFERKPSSITFWTIAFAVMLGILMADVLKTVAIATYARWEFRTAMASFKKANEATREAQERDERIRADADAKAAQARENAIMAAEAAQRARATEAARKEAAWSQYYKPATICSDPPDAAAFTKCANDHLKAKKQFEATYRPIQP